MTPHTPSIIRPVSSSDEMATALRIRHQVFVEEQGVPRELEGDADDAAAHHVLLWCGDEAIGVARLVRTEARSGKIGRVALLSEHRGRGHGTRLVRRLIDDACALGCREVFLDAQLSVLRFYERLGFIAEGGEFLDAGILHRRMRCLIAGREEGR